MEVIKKDKGIAPTKKSKKIWNKKAKINHKRDHQKFVNEK